MELSHTLTAVVMSEVDSPQLTENAVYGGFWADCGVRRSCTQGGKRSRKRPYRRPFVLITFPPGRLVIDYNSRQGDFHLIKPGQNPAWL